MKKFVGNIKQKVGQFNNEIHALWLAYKDPRTPLYAKVFAALVAGYALSPIDLIPDPIPVLGYLDDAVLLPLGVILARRMIPDEVLSECRDRAREMAERGEKPVSRAAAVVVVVLWVALAALGVFFGGRIFGIWS
ncbi:MAG: YkvA family protein [Rubrobacteraceae bacterium]